MFSGPWTHEGEERSELGRKLTVCHSDVGARLILQITQKEYEKKMRPV